MSKKHPLSFDDLIQKAQRDLIQTKIPSEYIKLPTPYRTSFYVSKEGKRQIKFLVNLFGEPQSIVIRRAIDFLYFHTQGEITNDYHNNITPTIEED